MTWGGWSFESLQEWWLFTKLAVPGMLMVILEWGAFEAVNFLAGVLGETELSANIVWFQVVELLYIVRISSKFSYLSRVSYRGGMWGAGISTPQEKSPQVLKKHTTHVDEAVKH